MSHFSQPAWTHPAASSPSRPPAPSGRAPGTGHFLSGGVSSTGESRRITAGLIGLALISVALLNFGILGGARERLSRERWGQISATLDAKREEVRDLLWQFEHQAEYVAGQPLLVRAAHDAAQGGIPPQEAAALEDELSRAARTFDFRSIQLLDSGGRPIAGGAGALTAPLDVELARLARLAGHPLMGDVRGADGQQEALALAVPVGNDPNPAVMLFRGSVEDVLLPLLMSWPGLGPTAGAYLVKREGESLVCLTSPPTNLAASAGDRIPLDRPSMRAAAMAVEGVESTVETVDAQGRPLWAVTRALPERGWGIVAQVDRSVALTGLRSTVAGLLALDLVMLLLGVAAVWFWRRQYLSGLARRENELTRRHAARIQAIVDTAFDAIFTFDRDGKIVSVNRAGTALFGRPAAEMEGEPFRRFLQREGVAGTGPTVADFAHGAVMRADALRADGSLVPVEFSLGSAGEGAELLYTAIVRDITERVESEKRIQSFAEGLEQSNRRLEELNAQLEEASRLKSEFLANTSHELRTPLNGMIGFLQLVLDGLCDSKDEEREFLQQALQCSRHLLGLINDVLDIAKIEAGKLSLDIERVDVGQLFDEVYTVTHVQAAQRGVKLVLVPPADRGLGVRGDFGKTKQMIFEKFIQADGSTTRRYGGTGLGLAITRSLVELMGGIIGVSSDGEGRGTRMYFSLPIWREESGPVEEDSTLDQISGPGGGSLVLVVEDDAVFRRYLTTLLHQHGFRTVEARHAEDGWVLARRLRPAVVVTDYALTCPEGANLRTGWDLAERMTSDALTRHIPMIFVTGFDEELRDKLKSTAFARKPEHLVKPIDGSVLVEKIQEMVGSIQNRVIRVLMADDDPAVSAYVRKVLPVERFHVEVAANGEQCLHALRTQPRGFDLLLLDLMMPEVSGYDVLREMTLTGLSTSLPVLVLTNYPEPRNEDEKRLLEQGLVLDVLPKSAVHDNPQLLPHVIDWQLQVVREMNEIVGEEPGEERAAA